MNSKDLETLDKVPKDAATSISSTSSAVTEAASVTDKKVDDELDADLEVLLDDALGDFDKPHPPPPKFDGLDAAGFLNSFNSKSSRPSSNSTNAAAPQASADDDMSQIWSEEFIREATAQFEKKMREYVGQQGNLPSSSKHQFNQLRGGENLNKVLEAATSAALGSTSGSSSGLATGLNEAIKNINLHPDIVNDPTAALSDAEITKLMGTLGLGMGMGEGEVDDADMNAFLPFMTNMMQKLLSKELLHPVLTDLVDRYPDWLADNRAKISSAEYEKYNQQYEYMKRICEEYSREKDSDTENIKSQRFDVISDLMLKVQYIGPPPSDLVGDMNPNGLASLDPSIASQCTLM